MWLSVDYRMYMSERGLESPYFLPARVSGVLRQSTCLSSLQFLPWKSFTQTFLHALLPTDFRVLATHDKEYIKIISVAYFLEISWIVP